MLLCNGSSRSSFRHPLPAHTPIGRRAMLVACARRDGMVANVTRWVRFGTPKLSERNAEQWELHHQGGPAGYAGRDPRVTAAAEDAMGVNQAFTWNPSGPGVKIEDTVQPTSSGIRVLTADPRWPAESVNGIGRPLTLQL